MLSAAISAKVLIGLDDKGVHDSYRKNSVTVSTDTNLFSGWLVEERMSNLMLSLTATLLASALPQADAGKQLMYTTYFYTASEAIVHGYEPDTHVRIVSLAKGGEGTVWSGVVGRGKTVLVPTGMGVFGFLADKKASILVGTPSSCTAVGYFVKNREGSFRSDHFFAQLPSSISMPSAKVVVWAWDDAEVTGTDMTGDKRLFKTKLKAGGHYTIDSNVLSPLGSHVLEIKADQKAIEVEIYYDEGFIVPSKDGRGSGRLFYTYVGDITEGVNDLILTSYFAPAKIEVTDADSGKTIWSGTVEKNGVHAITMKNTYVKVVADKEISVGVGPYEHYQAGYAEHHFSMGAEGTGIENEFLVTTPGELWIFSYYDGNEVNVTDVKTGREVWRGMLAHGKVQGLTPGFGFFRVKSTRGISVMGGASSCGGEYSPAGGMFAVDETLFKVVAQIQADRREQAAKQGRTLSAAEESAPLTPAEMTKAKDAVQSATGRPASEDEVKQRLDTMIVH
jgi:hypothetical protein